MLFFLGFRKVKSCSVKFEKSIVRMIFFCSSFDFVEGLNLSREGDQYSSAFPPLVSIVASNIIKFCIYMVSQIHVQFRVREQYDNNRI